MIQISLKAARVNADLSQSEAAKLIGIATKSLQNYEQGRNAIPGYVFKKAVKIYGIPHDNIRLPVIGGSKNTIFSQKNTV